MMSILMEQLINITDAVFLGHVGEVELGASAIAGIYYLAVYMLGFGFSIGLQVMIARRNGEQNYALRFCFCTGKPNRASGRKWAGTSSSTWSSVLTIQASTMKVMTRGVQISRPVTKYFFIQRWSGA